MGCKRRDEYARFARNPDGSFQYVSDSSSQRAVMSLLMIRAKAIIEAISLQMGTDPDKVSDE